MLVQHHVIIEQQLQQCNFGKFAVFVPTQFDRYLVQPFIRESLVCSKHFDFRKSQVVTRCVLQNIKFYLHD